MNPHAAADPLVEEILDVFAKEARIDRSQLQLDARAEDLGAASLDVALAMFELEDRYGIRLPELAPDAPSPTVGEVLQQVLAALAASQASGPGPAAVDDTQAMPVMSAMTSSAAARAVDSTSQSAHLPSTRTGP